MCCVVPFAVSKFKSSQEDAGRDRGKFDSASRRGGHPCSFSQRLRAERVEPFAEGLAIGVELDGRGLWRTRARRSALTACDPSLATAWDPSPATAWVPSAATAWVPSAATALDASAATAWLQSPVTAWALDMLHRIEEHALKSLHFD